MVMRPPFLLTPRVFWGKILTPPANSVLYLPMYPPNVSPTLDYSGHGNDGTITGATWGQLPSGLWYLSFDGDDDKIDCGNGILTSNNESFTALAWAYHTSDDNEGVIGKDPDSGVNRNWFVSSLADHKLRCRIYETDGGEIASDSGSDTFPENTWTQVGLVVDYENTKLYQVLNGAFTDMTGAWDGTIKNAAIALTIGFYYNTPTYNWDGYIALPSVQDVALTEAQVAARYSQERGYFGV